MFAQHYAIFARYLPELIKLMEPTEHRIQSLHSYSWNALECSYMSLAPVSPDFFNSSPNKHGARTSTSFTNMHEATFHTMLVLRRSHLWLALVPMHFVCISLPIRPGGKTHRKISKQDCVIGEKLACGMWRGSRLKLKSLIRWDND